MTRDNRWTVSHIAEIGDEVRLLRSVKIWQYGRINVLSAKRTEVFYDTIPAESVGKVVFRETFANSTKYIVEFGDKVVEGVWDWLLSPKCIRPVKEELKQ